MILDKLLTAIQKSNENNTVTPAMRNRDKQRKLDLKYIVENLNVWKMVEGRYPNAMDAEQHSEFLVALPRTPHDPLEGKPLNDFPVRHGYYYDNIDPRGKYDKMTFRLWTYLEDKNDPALAISRNYQKDNPHVLLVTHQTNLAELFAAKTNDPAVTPNHTQTNPPTSSS